MPASPYPPFPPNTGVVLINGGYDRTCLVLEIYTTGHVDQARLAQIEDTITMALDKFKEIEKLDVVRPTRFTAPLSKALHLPR